jgi:enoyl-CoA hydratase
MATAKIAATHMLTLNMNAHHGTKLKTRKNILATLDAAIALDAAMVIDL